jgi:dienelactone hydrolase
MSETTKIGSVSRHIAKPSGSSPWPALVAIQEWWGLDQQTKFFGKNMN